MKTIFLIPFQFMRKNKGQTISILLSMVLSVAMMISISCLMHSAHVNKTESIRARYGDYHYYLLGEKDLYQNIIKQQVTSQYNVQNIQIVEIKDSINITDNLNVVLTFANSSCRGMIKREIIDGKYPDNNAEIALDRYTLRLIGEEDEIGSDIEIGGNKFILSGIIEDSVEYAGNAVEAYVCKKYPSALDLGMIYLKFDETQDIYEQVVSFAEFCEIETADLESNGELIDCVIDGNIERMVNIVKSVAEDDEANFITLLMKLETELHMTTGLVSCVLGIFSILIIYSIFSVSASKRMKEYSILQTIGVSRGPICIMLMIEMLFLLFISYPLGTILGIYFDKLLFEKVSTLFSGTASLIENTHTGAGEISYSLGDTQNEMFFIDKSAIISCALLMLVLIIVICLIISAKIDKKTIVEMMKGEKNHFYKEKIYSIKRRALLNVLTNRFMFVVPSKFIGIILSLSVGGILILTTNYIATNTRMNNEMVMHSQEGLSSDVKVSVGKDEFFDYGITSDQYEQLSSIDGVTSISGFQYSIGEIAIEKDKLLWKEFWPEIANDGSWKQTPDIMERFNGIVTENEEEYKIKTNIYGYDDSNLDLLNDYVLDGNINKKTMLQENGVVIRTITDAQNNHDGLDIQVGDTIVLKTVEELSGDKELLRFMGPEELYQEKEFRVLAIVSNSLVTNTEYIGTEGIDVIMTGEQMYENYLIDRYNMLTINKEQKDDIEVVSKIQNVLSSGKNIKIIDNSLSIKAKNDEVKRAEALLYGIAILLVIIAVINIINTIFHLLDAKRYSFAVLRAIGITETDFYKMLLVQALKYAFVTSAVIVGIFFGIIQQIIGDMLKHVYGYINQIQSVSIGMIILVFGGVVAIFVVTVTVIAKQILQMDIIDELKAR